MTRTLDAPEFFFVDRPFPIPGNLRLSWRIPVLLLMLHFSRQQKSSLVKLHVLNDAIQSPRAALQLRKIETDSMSPLSWQPRIEPAFARAIDFAVGDRLVEWISTTNGPGLILASQARPVAKEILELTDVLVAEKALLSELSSKVSEALVKRLVSLSRSA